MTKVRDRANLAESTVQRADVLAAAHGKRRRTTQRRSRATRVAARDVHPQVWATALRLAGGNARRLQVVDSTTVLVANHPGRGGGRA